MRAHLSVAIACALYLLLGLITGNVLATGQAEPLRWLSASMYFTAGLAFVLRRDAGMSVIPSFRGKPESLSRTGDRGARRGGLFLAAALLSGLQTLLFSGTAGGYWNFGHAALLVCVNFALLLLFSLLFRWKRGAPLLLGLALAGGLILPARIYFWPLEPAPWQRRADRELTIMSSLPIGPFGEKDIASSLGKPTEPVFARLSVGFTILFADSLQAPPQGRLLLAHPRALHPADLAALDTWVRGGGEAVILADPLLAWPSALSPADPRRPPVTSLLDPLLAHWGLRLEPPNRAQGVVQRRLANGRLLAMIAPGHFRTTGASCRIEEQGLIARCRLGKGRALLLADADMLHPALWMGGDGNWPAIDRDRLSDNMAILAGWLGESEPFLPPRTGWILTNRDICYGLLAAAVPILLLGLPSFLMGRSGNRTGKSWERAGKLSLFREIGTGFVNKWRTTRGKRT